MRAAATIVANARGTRAKFNLARASKFYRVAWQPSKDSYWILIILNTNNFHVKFKSYSL
jgi:hypothetical protein